MILKPLLSLSAVILLAACTTAGGPKQQAGSLLGAAGGGLLGAQAGSGAGQLAATAFGTLAGALIGSEVGASLDRADALHAQRQAAIRRQVMIPGGGGVQTPTTSFSRTAPSARGSSFFDGASPTASGCQPLSGGFRQAFACVDPRGRWFVVQ